MSDGNAREPDRGQLSLQVKTEISRKLSREWSEHLTLYEYRVLRWLIDNTIHEGCLTGAFTHWMILEGYEVGAGWQPGVGYQPGTRFAPGLGHHLSRRTLIRVLQSLQTKGALSITEHDDVGLQARIYRVNTTWMPGDGGRP